MRHNLYYTEPKIKDYPLLNPDGTKGKRWYVWFRFNNVLRKYELDINNHATYEARMEAAIVLREAIKLKLKSGWNPVADKVLFAPELPKMNICEGLDFALDKMKSRLAPKTFSGYKGSVNFIKESAKRLKFNKINIQNISRRQIKSMLEDIKIKRNWSAHAYNKNIGHLKSVFSELIEYEIIENNPLVGIRSLKYNKPIKELITPSEQTQIIKHLSQVHPTFLRFVKVLYQTGIRPKELLLLKVKNIDLENELIFVSKEVSKNAKDGLVPIKNDILNDLSEVIEGKNPDYYLFGSPRKKGGIYNLKKSYLPSPNPTKRDTATNHWKKWIKDDLGIEKNMYDLKHKSANDMLFAGVPLDSIKTIYRHSSEKITEIYANQINKKRFNDVKSKEIKFK